MSINPKKRTLARIMQLTQASRVGLLCQRLLLRNSFIRAVNYHQTPAAEANTLRQHLEFYRKYFSDVSFSDLKQFFATGRWHKSKPGILISFDDGYRSNIQVAAPLLEEYGLTGWFFVPTNWVEEATQKAEQNQDSGDICQDEAGIMTWAEIKKLQRNHVVGCHTATHHRLSASSPSAQLRAEIVDAKRTMEEKLSCEIPTFCWVGGEEKSYSREAAQLIEEAGFQFSFMTNNAPILPSHSPLQLQRTNIETSHDLNVLAFQLSGLMDLLYTPKRNRVNRMTSSN